MGLGLGMGMGVCRMRRVLRKSMEVLVVQMVLRVCPSKALVQRKKQMCLPMVGMVGYV